MGCLFSHVLYFTEKFTLWLSALLLISCLVVTLMAMLLVGIGLGYNYCYVDNRNKTKTRLLAAVDRPPYPGYHRHYSNRNTLPSRHQTHKAKTTQKRYKQDRHVEGTGVTRSRYLGYPWNRGEDSDMLYRTVSTKLVDNIKIPFVPNRIVRINITNMSNGSYPLVIPSQSRHITNEDTIAGFKQFDEINESAETAGFIQYNESEKKYPEKRGMTLQMPLNTFSNSENGYTLLPVKYLKLKTKGSSLPTRERSVYEDEAYKSETSTYKNSNDKSTDSKNFVKISGLDLMALLSQLRAENRNYSLQILV